MPIKSQIIPVSLVIAALMGCGRSHGNMAHLEADDDGQLVSGKLFYDMPIHVHKATYVRNPNGPVDDKEAGWTIAVQPASYVPDDGPAGSYEIRVDWDESNYGYGYSSLNLTSGIVHTHAIHSYDFSYPAPEAQGDINSYMPVIDEMIENGRKANAPADVAAYLQHVKDRLIAGHYNSQRSLDKDRDFTLLLGQNNTFKLAYTATESRDLLVRLFDEVYKDNNWQEVELASGRTTVQAGAGSVSVEVKLPAATVSGAKTLCVDTSTLPAGAPDPHGEILQNNFCLSVR